MLLEENAIMILELKYCEQCGALWLRRREQKSSLCAFCGQFRELLPIREKDNRRRGCSGPRKRKQARVRRRAANGVPNMSQAAFLVGCEGDVR
jgi:hypothetical protein